MARRILPAPAMPGRGLDASWRESAACLGADTELFFPVGSAGPRRRASVPPRPSAGAARCEPAVWPMPWIPARRPGYGAGTTRTSAGSCVRGQRRSALMREEMAAAAAAGIAGAWTTRCRLTCCRSSGVVPPQMPWPGSCSSANDRHCSLTGHRAQIALARATCVRAGPLIETGKNRSGSAWRKRRPRASQQRVQSRSSSGGPRVSGRLRHARAVPLPGCREFMPIREHRIGRLTGPAGIRRRRIAGPESPGPGPLTASAAEGQQC